MGASPERKKVNSSSHPLSSVAYPSAIALDWTHIYRISRLFDLLFLLSTFSFSSVIGRHPNPHMEVHGPRIPVQFPHDSTRDIAR